MIPTIRRVMKCYAEISQAERMKTGRPCEATVANVLRGTAIVCKAAGIGLGASVERLTRQSIDAALVSFLEKGLSRLSAWSYVLQLRGLFSKWALPYYRDRGWEIPSLELPVFRAQAPRYKRPSVEMLRRVKAWYRNMERQAFDEAEGSESIEKGELKRLWLAATMMLEFAMRNGDVLRLQPDNFEEHSTGHQAQGTKHKAQIYLSYTPHKTEMSSGRHVRWPVHMTIWNRLESLVRVKEGSEGSILEALDSGVFEKMNRQLRLLGFNGGKASYELRKICIDHIYQKYGAEMATSISGDDIKTVSRYYADPSAVNAVGVRILDLL